MVPTFVLTKDAFLYRISTSKSLISFVKMDPTTKNSSEIFFLGNAQLTLQEASFPRAF